MASKEYDFLSEMRMAHLKDERALSAQDRERMTSTRTREVDEKQFRDHRVQDEVKRAREAYHLYGRMPKPSSYTKDSSDVYGLFWFGQGKLAEELEQEAREAAAKREEEEEEEEEEGRYGDYYDSRSSSEASDRDQPVRRAKVSIAKNNASQRPGDSRGANQKAQKGHPEADRRKQQYYDSQESNSDGYGDEESYNCEKESDLVSDRRNEDYRILRPVEAPPLNRALAEQQEYRNLQSGSAPRPSKKPADIKEQAPPHKYGSGRGYTSTLPVKRKEKLAFVSDEVRGRAEMPVVALAKSRHTLQAPWAEHYSGTADAQGNVVRPLYDVAGDVQNLEPGYLSRTSGIPRGRNGVDQQQRYAREAQSLAVTLDEQRKQAIKKVQQARLKEALDSQVADQRRRKRVEYQNELVTVYGPAMADILDETERIRRSKAAHVHLMDEWKEQSHEAQQRREQEEAYYSQRYEEDEDGDGIGSGPRVYAQRTSEPTDVAKRRARQAWLEAWQDHQYREGQLKKQVEEEQHESARNSMRPAVANYANRLLQMEQYKREAQQQYRADLDQQRYGDNTRKRLALEGQYKTDRTYL